MNLLIALVCGWLLCFLHVTNAVIGTCQKLTFHTTALALNSTCGDVVDYEYYLPYGYAEHLLNSQAYAKLSDPRFIVLDPSCQLALKKLVCSSVYLKCVPNIVLTQASTYNYYIYSDVGQVFPVPFQRPCQRLCTTITAPTSTCWGLLTLFGQQPNCTATFDYSSGLVAAKPKQYDVSNNAAVCNEMTAVSSVASTKEHYLQQETGACAGITTEIWVPPPSKVSVTLAPMQRPYQLQLAIDLQLKTLFTGVEPFVSSDCMFAMRKFYCGKSYMYPQPHRLGESLTAPQLFALKSKGVNTSSLTTVKTYFPSYPSRGLCTSYLTSCAALHHVMPQYAANCTAMVSGVSSFPVANQTVTSISIPGTAIKLAFKTPPNLEGNAVDIGYGTSSLGTCNAPLSTLLNETYQCSSVVDYSFYLPADKNLTMLDEIVSSRLNNTKLSILPPTCLVALKKLVCGSVYMKCQPGIAINNTYTWNYDVYAEVGIPFPLPIQRPCVSLCEDANNACMGLLSLLHVAPSCTARYDYSNGIISTAQASLLDPYQFDQSNDTAKCNAVPAELTIGSAREDYQYKHGGVCEGITTEVYIPPGGQFRDLFPTATDILYQNPPYVIQEFIETILNSSLSHMPVFLASDCHFAMRKYFCSKSYLRPSLQVLGRKFREYGINDSVTIPYFTELGLNATKILNFEFYLPAYPSLSICEDYSTSCSSFFNIAKNSLSAAQYQALLPQCNATSSSGDYIFSDSNQTIMELSFTVGGSTTTIAFQTEPQSYNNASDLDYDPVCPTGFVVPTDPSNMRSRNVEGTACALACYGSPIIFPSEWESFQVLARTCSRAGLVLTGIFLLLWICDHERRKQRLVIVFGLSSLLMAITFVVSSSKNPNELFCSSNSVPKSSKDGFTFCYFQGLVLTYCSLVNNLSWLMIAVDLFLKISVGVDKRKDHQHIYLPIIFILPIFSVIYAIVSESYGYSTAAVWCFNINIPSPGQKTNQDVWYVFVPMTIFTCTGVVLMFGVIASSIRTIWHNSLTQLLIDVKVLKTPMAFVCFGAVCWFSLIQYRYRNFEKGAFVRDDYIDWIGCVFRNFNGDNDSYAPACGRKASHMLPYPPMRWQLICLCGQSIFVSSIYLVSYVYSFLAQFFFSSFTCVNCLVKNAVSTVIIVHRRTTMTLMRRSMLVVPDNTQGSVPEVRSGDGESGAGHVASSDNIQGRRGSESEHGANADEKTDGQSPLRAAIPTPYQQPRPVNAGESAEFGRSMFNLESAAGESAAFEEEVDDINYTNEQLAAIKHIVGTSMGELPAARPGFATSQRYEAIPEGEDGIMGDTGVMAFTRSKKLKSNKSGKDSDDFSNKDQEFFIGNDNL